MLAWYTTFVTNTETYPEAPTSWADAWGPQFKDALGWGAEADSNYLLDITAVTFFGGQDILNTRDGLEKVMQKAAELKPNVTLWYRDEGSFQQVLQTGEIPAGQYYHDVTNLMVADGFPVRSTFPKEGGVIDFGSWGLVTGSKMGDVAHVFIDYCCTPEIQAKITRNLGTRADHPARADGPDRRGVRRGVERHSADRARLRRVHRRGRLDLRALEGTDHRRGIVTSQSGRGAVTSRPASSGVHSQAVAAFR